MMLLLYGITFAQTDSIDYLGQKSPEYYPEKFADGIISSGKGESGPVFSPGGNELFFTGYDSQKYIYYINYMKKTNGVWSERMPAPFSDYKNGSSEAVPCFTPDGKRIYYSSNRKGGFGKLDIWYVDKTDTGWGSPVNAGDIINSAGNDDFPFISGDGSLYFNSDREKVEWDYDIFYAKCHDGKYSIATNLGDSVNSSSWDACPTIVNDKLIFWSKRSGGFGKGDIYFSRISGDSFGKAELMSANYNSSSSEFGLVLSPDKKYFFFSRGDGDINSKIYWVDAEALNYLGVREAPFNYITSWYGGNSAQM